MKSAIIPFLFCIFFLCGCKEEKKGLEVEQIGKTELLKKAAEKKKEQKSIQKEDRQEKQAQDASEAETPDLPTFELKGWESDIKKPGVEDSASNVKIERREEEETETETETDNKTARKKAPPDSLAGKLGKSNKVFTWKPALHFESSMGTRHPDIALSADQSLLAIVERTGKDSGPNGSRLILYDTYSWEILRIFEFSEDKISHISFVQATKLIALFSGKQSSLDKPNRLSIFDLTEEKEIFSDSKIKNEITDMTAWNCGVLVKNSGEKSEIFYLKINGADFELQSAISANPDGVFAVFDDETAILAGNKQIEFFDGSLKIFKKIDGGFTDAYSPGSATFAGRKDRIAVSAYSKPAYIFKDKDKSELCESSGRILEFTNDKLILEEYKNNKLDILDPNDFKETASLIISKLKPATNGCPVFMKYLKHHEKYLVIDSFGNIGMYYLPGGKKWKKILILKSGD